MTLILGTSGYEGDFRAKGIQRLHLSLRTKKKATAQARHDAVVKLFRQRRVEMIEQLRAGVLTVERVEAMVEHHEPLLPLAHDVAQSTHEAPWPTIDAAAEAYVVWMEETHRADATRTLAGYQLKRFRDFTYEGQRIGDLTLDTVPSAAVLAYQRSMLDTQEPPNTITTYMARVRALWAWAVKQETKTARETKAAPRLLYSPVDPDYLVREVHRRDRVLSVAEADRLMARTPDPIRFTVGCGLLAGMRISEVLHLRPVLDVDLEFGVINIRRQPDWKPKTRRSVRLVPMADPLRALAETHVREYASDQWMHPSPVIPGQPITDLGFRQYFIPVVEGAGLVYGRDKANGVTYHTLRHSFASHAVMRGVDLYTVAKLLGDSLKTVEDTYADLSPDFKRAAVAKLAGAFAIGGGEE